MSYPDVPESTTGAVHFRIGKVPVSIHISSPIVLALLGLDLASEPVLLVLWVVLGIVLILVHELGHSAVALLGGSTPRVDLMWLGGVTRYRPTERLRARLWSLSVSLAGPATGIVIGLIIRHWVYDTIPLTAPYAAEAAYFAWYISYAWALFNLLPVLPLDGGNALRALMPGTDAARTKRTSAVGVVVGAGVVVWGLLNGQTYIALFFGLLAYRNVQLFRSTTVVRRGRPLADDHPPELADHVAFEELRNRARTGDASDEEILRTVREAADQGDHLVVVEFVNMALGHGARDPRLPWQAARSWTTLDQRDRANRMVATAVEFGAAEHEVAADPALRPLHDHPRWPLSRPSGE